MSNIRRLRGEAGRFVGLGLVSYALGLGLSALFRERFHLSEEHAVALTLTILFITNFWLSRRYVFRTGGNVVTQLVRFGVASFAMRAGEYALFYLLLHSLHLHYLAALTAALMISNVLKFFLYRTLVFGRGLPGSLPASSAASDDSRSG